MSELSSIKSQALTERIEERLFAYILDNHLKVGAKLPNEHELAAHFEVSRGTVREAVTASLDHALSARQTPDHNAEKAEYARAERKAQQP